MQPQQQQQRPKSKAALASYEKEQQAMAAAYVETVQMLNSDAARKQEAAQVAALEALRLETSKRSERVKALKAKSMLISAENVSKQELVDSMSVRLEEMSKELSRMALLQAKDQMAKKAEDEKAVALQVIFEKTLDQAVSSSTGSTSVHSELFAAYAAQTGPRHTLVYFCPDGQTREEAVDTTSIRLGRTTTFREITVNVARFFGLPYDVALLEDENNTIWPLDVVVGREITRYRGDQTIRLVRRDDAAEHREARASHLDDENDAEEMGAGQLLKALGGPTGAGGAAGGGGGGDGAGGGGGDGAADDEAAKEQQAAMEALAAMGDEESDSDDDANQRKEYVEPPINYRREIKDLILHFIFLGLLIMSTSLKRSIPQANALFLALETIFIDEEFGDYNEKSFMDVRKFDEVWDWTNDVLIPGLFESDVDETGNIMMYNQLVGAVRLRQMRVSNTSCILSENIQRQVQVGDFSFKQSFYFPAKNLGSGGGCFSRYTRATRDTAQYGPCTAEGREALEGIEADINKYNTSCANSGFSWWSEARTKAPRVIFGDGSGYVRDVLPDEPPPGRDTPRLPQERMQETVDELRNFLWLDERTRAMIVSFSVYNANFNLYSACNFIFEFTAGGVIQPSYQFKVLKLELYENIASPLDAVFSREVQFDVAVNLLVIRLLIKELARYFHIRWNYGTSLPYLTNVWNMLEVANITPFAFAWASRLSYQYDPNRALYLSGMFGTQRYAEVGTAAASYATGFNFDSISVLVSFLKLFKYFRLSNRFALLWNVLSVAGRDMAYFFFMLFLFLFGFVVFAQEMFGTTIDLFSDSVESMTTLLKIIFGIVDIYWDMIRSQQNGFDRLMAIFFFFFYVVWMFFIFINIFLAILNDAYGGVKQQMEEKEEEARQAREEAKALGHAEEKGGMRTKIDSLRRAARGRLSRFQGRIQSMAKRRKATPLSAMDAIASVTAEGVQLEDLREDGLRRRKKKKKRVGVPPPGFI